MSNVGKRVLFPWVMCLPPVAAPGYLSLPPITERYSELISRIVAGQDLKVPEESMDDYLQGLKVVPGGTTGR
ncbi:hypothetical protein [Arthrobacter sp. HS15c]|uniref:hypothetical protein n=1 Tax=Arthrobacter sp. HS15c TaxID=3230279 RepID=UPI003467E9B4